MPRPSLPATWDSNGTHTSAVSGSHQTDGFATDEVPSSSELNEWMKNAADWLGYLDDELTQSVWSGLPPAYAGVNAYWDTVHDFFLNVWPHARYESNSGSDGTGDKSLVLHLPFLREGDIIRSVFLDLFGNNTVDCDVRLFAMHIDSTTLDTVLSDTQSNMSSTEYVQSYGSINYTVSQLKPLYLVLRANATGANLFNVRVAYDRRP